MTLKSLAAVLTKLNAPLKLIELTVPPLLQGQVLVKVKFSGICRSQVNEIKGFKGEDPFLPHTLGHEGSGIVKEIGPGVKKVKVGDHVVLTWIKGEGLAPLGTTYRAGNLAINSGPISTFLQLAVVSENRLVPIPKEISLKLAALFGCAIPTGAGIIFNETKLKKNQTVAIFGLGGIGLSALLAASQKKAGEIFAIDKHQSKLDLAKRLGATHTLLFDKERSCREIQEKTGGLGVDVAIEAAGRREVMEVAFQATQDRGLCILAGNVPQGTLISCNPFDFIKGKRLIGTWGGGVIPDRDIPLFLNLFLKQQNQLNQLINYETPLQEINQTIDLLSEGKIARALLSF